MGKLIRHKWNKITTSGKLKLAVCERCHCEKFYSDNVGQLIFRDRFDLIHYRTPRCVLPNTLLNTKE